MTEQEYIAQNALGFEGDTHLADAFKELIDLNGIEVVIETGTYRGATTAKLAEMVSQVHTIEVKAENFDIARNFLNELGLIEERVFAHFGNSADILPRIIPYLDKKKILFFLDAHWEDYNPLLDELKIITDFGLKPIIIIHDFKVPDRPELGYDSYKGQDYDFDWIKEALHNIYGENFFVQYNEQATGAQRGVIFIQPTK